MHLISTLSFWAEHTSSKVWGSWSPKFYKWKFWSGNNYAHKMSPASITNAWIKRKNKSRKMNLSNQNQIQNQDEVGRKRWHHHWKRHYWRRHHKNPHLQEQTEVLDKWTSQGGVPFEGLKTPNPHWNPAWERYIPMNKLAWGRCISNYPDNYLFTSFYFK